MYNDRKAKNKTKQKQTNLSIQIHIPPANWATSSTGSCKFRVSIRRPMKETLVVHFMPIYFKK